MRYTVTGRVHPERAAVTFQEVRGSITDGVLSVMCDASELCVIIESKSVQDPLSAKIVAEDFAHIVVASLGFSLGSTYTVEAIQVIDEAGRATVYGVRNQQLVFENQQEMFNHAIFLAGSDVFFRIALRDYVRAITDVADCATYCYRTIEAIKSSFDFRSGGDGWTAMHAALATSRDDITSHVKTFADPIRHGNWIKAPPTNAQQRTQMLATTRDVLCKYIAHMTPNNALEQTRDK